MAPSSPDVSILNSTLRLFTFLDLNNEQQHHHHQQEMQNVEDMDIDQVMEVPDTPERLVGRKTNGGEGLAKEFSSSVVGASEPSDLVDNGSSNLSRNHVRSFVRHGKNKFSIRDEASRINHTVLSVSDSPSRFPRSSHGRRAMRGQFSRKSETRLSTLPHGHDGSAYGIAEVPAVDVKTQDRNKKRVLHRGNTSCDTAKTTDAEVPSRSLAYKDDDDVLYSSVRSEYTGVPERACSRGSSKDVPSKEIRKGSIGCSSRTSKASSNVCEEKTPVDVSNTWSGASLEHATLTDFSQESMPKAEKIMLRSPIIPTRTTGQKRLVRNGCISPYNIAQSKQTGECHANSPKDAGTTSSEIHIVSPNSEGNQFVGVDKKKGKGVMIGSSPTKQYDAKTINFSDRSSLNSREVAGIRDAGEDDIGCSKTIDGWRSTHSRSKVTSSDLSDEAGHLSGRVDVAGHVLGQTHEDRKRNVVRVSGKNTCPETDIPQVRNLVSPQHGSTHLVQESPSTMFELCPENSRNSGRYKLTKRQRRPSLPRSNLGECSSSGFDDSDITCLWSSQEPANARSTRSRDPHHRGISGPIIEIDEFSPEVRCRNPVDTSQPVNGDLDARASQMEADELLARQLQEQFYHETQGVGGGEIDAGLAWTLQQQENAQRTSPGGQHASHRRDSAMSHLYRQYPSESIPSSSIRSRTRARGSPFPRTARLRNASRHSSSISLRERNSRFPPNVDIETRIHILEALEAAVGNHNNMPMGSHFFQVQRDFNENDYEMLLALDEDNHRHVGASVHQINGLPQSTVQTDNFEETCAICLENPTIGETIRHLPCLHKFHKDCIDSWLRRSTACPVCKSSIT